MSPITFALRNDNSFVSQPSALVVVVLLLGAFAWDYRGEGDHRVCTVFRFTLKDHLIM